MIILKKIIVQYSKLEYTKILMNIN
jgi:hypothetical protein